MLSEHEILLRNVKCAVAREGFISFHFLREQKISQGSQIIISDPQDISLHIPPFLLYNHFINRNLSNREGTLNVPCWICEIRCARKYRFAI